ncbi:hypothetical protein MP638_002326 [Amoeboaphelidium occidentale]|nr:hypothetical protein MP638_002326 [Amoeboaphelidium occidentale]
MLRVNEKETKLKDTLTETDKETMSELMRILRDHDDEDKIDFERDLYLTLVVNIYGGQEERWVLHISGNVLLSVQRANKNYTIDTGKRKVARDSLFYWSDGQYSQRIKFYAPFATSILSGEVWTDLSPDGWKKGNVGENLPFRVQKIDYEATKADG